RIGPAVRPGLLPKAWRAGFREGSIPPEPPKWSRPGTPALVGPALRIEGSTYVQRTVTRLGADTTFAFGSYVLTATGKDALREFAQEIEVDTNLNDLIDIEPPTVTIEGHTDNVPYTSHPGGNQWLSEQRANAVRDFLLPLVPEGTTLNAVGYGATRPIASCITHTLAAHWGCPSGAPPPPASPSCRSTPREPPSTRSATARPAPSPPTPHREAGSRTGASTSPTPRSSLPAGTASTYRTA